MVNNYKVQDVFVEIQLEITHLMVILRGDKQKAIAEYGGRAPTKVEVIRRISLR